MLPSAAQPELPAPAAQPLMASRGRRATEPLPGARQPLPPALIPLEPPLAKGAMPLLGRCPRCAPAQLHPWPTTQPAHAPFPRPLPIFLAPPQARGQAAGPSLGGRPGRTAAPDGRALSRLGLAGRGGRARARVTARGAHRRARRDGAAGDAAAVSVGLGQPAARTGPPRPPQTGVMFYNRCFSAATAASEANVPSIGALALLGCAVFMGFQKLGSLGPPGMGAQRALLAV
jgi:hypothetical protein